MVAPRKSLGQHFLHDPAIIQRIVDCIAPQKGSEIIEIGPGMGALTGPLLETGARVQAVELDRRVLPTLESLAASTGRLNVHHADALRFDYASLYQGEPLRLVGNLPYQISSPLLFHLLKLTCPVQDMHFMLQQEVVDRMVAAPGNKQYGRLGIMLALHCRCELLMRVKPGAFRPPPKVNSAVVRLLPQVPDWSPKNPALYAQLVSAAFSARRKTILNALKSVQGHRIDAPCLTAAGIDPTLRPENLAAQDYARLADLLTAA